MCGRCGGDVTSQEMNDKQEPYLVFRKGWGRPNQLFVYNFKYLGIVLALAGDRALAEARSCVEGQQSCCVSLICYVTVYSIQKMNKNQHD